MSSAMLPPAQALELWFDDTRTVLVAMTPAVSIAGWTIVFEVTDQDGTVALTRDVSIVSATTGTVAVDVRPVADGLDRSQRYLYRFRRTDEGAEGTITHGPLTFLSP